MSIELDFAPDKIVEILGVIKMSVYILVKWGVCFLDLEDQFFEEMARLRAKAIKLIEEGNFIIESLFGCEIKFNIQVL